MKLHKAGLMTICVSPTVHDSAISYNSLSPLLLPVQLHQAP